MSLWPQTFAGARNSLFAAPAPGTHAEWLADLLRWRQTTRAAAALRNDSEEVYTVPALRWTQTSLVQTQVHSFDRMLWNETSGMYTVGRYLDDLEVRYGGIDSVLLWPTYPNIGLDDRSQFELMRLADVGSAIKDFHARGVKVLLPYNPWDQATRREGRPDWEAVAELAAATDADGFNGDTLQRVPREFWDAGLAAGRPLAIEPEGGGYPDTTAAADAQEWNASAWSPFGWAYHWVGTSALDNETTVYLSAPGVDRAKWLEPQGRHVTHVTDRWQKNRTVALQLAFFNGNGYESWENVWGLWNGITPRDAEALRRSATLLRYFAAKNFTRGFTAWVPHTPEVVVASLHASRFERSDGTLLWLIVNSGPRNVSGVVLALEPPRGGRLSARAGSSVVYLDVYHGAQLTPTAPRSPRGGAAVKLSLEVEAGGFGAVVAMNVSAGAGLPADLAALMRRMKELTKVGLSSFDDTWQPLQQTMEPVPTTPLSVASASPQASAAGTPPEPQELMAAEVPMVAVPRERGFAFRVAGVQVEGGCDPSRDAQRVCCSGGCSRWAGATNLTNCQCAMEAADDAGNDVQFPWEPHPSRHHAATLDLGPFLIDKTPVTRAAYARYLATSGYRPADSRGFLYQWRRDARGGVAAAGLPRGTERLPVTGVSHEEAALYCKAAGKRLPTSYEWQYAAQGSDGRRYPWGDAMNASRFPRAQHSDGSAAAKWSGPAAVDAFAGLGDSPFGMSDVVGNVWQWTASQFVDAHTRSILLRGSTSYVPLTSPYKWPSPPMKFSWYFQPALQLDRHNRWLAQSSLLSYSRAKTVGFRCLKDVAGGAPAPYHYRSAAPLAA